MSTVLPGYHDLGKHKKAETVVIEKLKAPFTVL